MTWVPSCVPECKEARERQREGCKHQAGAVREGGMYRGYIYIIYILLTC